MLFFCQQKSAYEMRIIDWSSDVCSSYFVLVILGVALADVGAGQDHLGAERAQVKDLFLRHLVRHHQGEAVALLRGDEGEAETGVAGCRLDQASSGLQPAVMLRRLDHRLDRKSTRLNSSN